MVIYTLSTDVLLNIHNMLKFEQIKKIHLELTTRCNARCPMCMRNYQGYEYNSGYPITELTLAQIQHILSPTVLRQIKSISINGNLGDFGLARDALSIVQYLVDSGVPRISICTNGSMRTPDWWAQLALPGVEVGFALDGLEDTHHLYRLDTNWHTIMQNAQALIKAGGRAVWRFVAFDHNRHQEKSCRIMAHELGFVRFENISDGRGQGPVFTRSGEFSHWLGRPNDRVTPVTEMVQHHLTWFDPKTVQIENDQPDLEINCEHLRGQEIYISADGSVYPCCFLGFYPASMNHPGNSQLAPLVQRNNALEYDLATCLEWFDLVEQSWQQKSIAQGRLMTCVNTCGRVNKKAP